MDLIRPEDIIAKYTPEEICEGAEAYYASLMNDPIHMQKPFRTVFEAAECLEGFGRLLRNLKLGPGMRVLDFGAGTCWISNYLAQMGCLPTACDPSASALEIGRNAIARNPWIEKDPTEYLVFKGRKIEAPDNTFDRILCFDVLHHLPNWEEILGEMHRVLKPGGLLGFQEPGYGHSSRPSSQYEMKHFIVLENDIRIDRIAAAAEAIGFQFEGWEAVSKRFFKLEEYAAHFKGWLGMLGRSRVKRKFYRDMKHHLKSSSCFCLSKGDFVLDSRVGAKLEATITARQSILEQRAGVDARLCIDVENTGIAKWLGDAPDESGKVFLGVHLLDETGTPIKQDFARTPIGEDLLPGDSRQLEITIPALEAGRYLLDFDMVAEKVIWFEMSQGAASEKARVKLVVR